VSTSTVIIIIIIITTIIPVPVRYTLQDEQVFAPLGPYKDRILTAGKYLNVFRECGSHAPAGPEAQALRSVAGG
jgi:hypothetical protein